MKKDILLRLIFFVPVLFMIPVTGRAASTCSFDVRPDFFREDITSCLEYYEDTTGMLGIADAASDSFKNRFKPLGSVRRLGFSDSVFWFHLKVNNNSSADLGWILEQNVGVDFVTVYYPDGSRFEKISGGLKTAYISRPQDTWDSSVFFLKEKPGSRDYYISLKSKLPIIVSIRAWNPDVYNIFREYRRIFFWIFFGILITLAVYNLMLSLAVKVQAYRYLALFIGLYCLVIFIDSLGIRILDSVLPDIKSNIMVLVYIILCLCMAAGIRFSRLFLATENNAPGLDDYLKGLQVITLLACFIHPVLKTSGMVGYSRIIMTILGIYVIGSCFAGGIYCLYLKVRSALYYSLAMLVYIIITLLKAIGIFGLMIAVEYWISFLGFTLTSFLLSVGITRRINLIWTERLHVMAELEQTKHDLEQRVEERTQELSGANTNLLKEIEDRKNTEEALYRSEQRLRAIFSSASVGIGVARADGQFIQINNTFAAMLGYSFEETACLSPSDILYPDDYPHVVENVRNVLKGKPGYSRFESRCIRKDKTVMWVSMSTSPLKDQEGNIEGVLIVFVDLTDLKEAEEALNISERHFRELVDNVKIIILEWDQEGTILFMNPFGLEFFGYTLEEIRGRNVIGTMVPQLETGGRDMKELLFDIGRHPDKYALNENEVINSRGDRFWVVWTNRPIPAVNGNISHILSSGADVTELRRIRDELERARDVAEAANRAKSEFLANMSHEIRTPLNAVLGFSDLLAGMISDEVQRSYVDAIQSGGRNLLLLINDILDLSKIEAGRMSLHPEAVSLKKIIEEVRSIFSLNLAEKGLDFIVRIDPLLAGDLMLDEVRFRQIMFNLIGNAVKFTRRGFVSCDIVLTERHEDGYVDIMLKVEDTGIGIAPDAHEYIFESFRQQDGNTTKKYGGTGLGLSITKRLVEIMGGAISLVSVVGQGTIFTVILKNILMVSEKAAGDRYISEQGKTTVQGYGTPAAEVPTGGSVAEHVEQTVSADVLESLQDDFMKRWNRVRAGSVIDDIMEFAKGLRSLGEVNDVPLILEYGKNLAVCVGNLDIEAIMETLDRYPGLVEKVKEMPRRP